MPKIGILALYAEHNQEQKELIGISVALSKSRLYGFLPKAEQKKLPQMLMTDTQIGMIARAYYNDESFSVPQGSKEINMRNVFNLLAVANKSSYIDNFLYRSLNATQLV
ncbi:MAG: DUF3871 family protein [Muribaculaceae bacterium]|nr:DUF3871 family protein [Muribaculaceae bacterium]